MKWKTKGEEQGVKTENSIKQKAIGITDSFLLYTLLCLHLSVKSLDFYTLLLYFCNLLLVINH